MGLLHKIALGAAGTLLGIATLAPRTLDDVVLAQDAKPMADTSKNDDHKISLNPYLKFSGDFYSVANEFYTKAKDKDKTKEALNIALYFDADNKQAQDLVKKVENAKLKKNDKEAKKVEETYGKTKQDAIDTLYKSAVEKLPTDKPGAFKDFEGIWKVDDKSVKPYEALGFVKNENGVYVPQWMEDLRDSGKKTLESASEGEQTDSQTDLIELGVPKDKIYARKSKDLLVRSTLSEESAKRAHKVSEATIHLLFELLNLKGPPYNIRGEKQTSNEPYHRITILNNDGDFKKFAESTTSNGSPSKVNSIHESWISKSDKSIFGYGHFHNFKTFEKSQEDNIAHYTLEDVLWRSSNYVDDETDKKSPWIFRPLCYHLTWQLLGTTTTEKLLNRDDKYEGDITKSTSVKPAEDMRRRSYELVTNAKSVSSLRLMRLTFDKFTEDDAAMAFAGVDYLLHEHKDKLVKLFSDEYNDNTELINVSKYELKNLIGMTPEEFDKGRDKFIIENYVGYRKPQN